MNTARKVLSALLSAIILLACCSPVLAAASGSFETTITVIGDSTHGAFKPHERYQTWIEKTTYTVQPGTTVFDLFKAAVRDNDMSYTSSVSFGFGVYLLAIQAPPIFDSYHLSSGDNGAGAGWMYTVNDPGASAAADFHPEGSNAAMDKYELQPGDDIVVHYMEDWNSEVNDPASGRYKAWLDAAPLPEDTQERGNSGNGNGNGGGGGGFVPGGYPAAAPNQPKEYTSADVKPVEGSGNHRLTVTPKSFIKASALDALPEDAALYADRMETDKLIRLVVPSPADLTGDCYFASSFEGEEGTVTSHFGNFYSNAIRVLAFEQKDTWGQTVELVLSSGLIPGFDKDKAFLCSYSIAENSYIRLDFTVDDQGYIHCKLANSNPVVFSDGEFVRK